MISIIIVETHVPVMLAHNCHQHKNDITVQCCKRALCRGQAGTLPCPCSGCVGRCRVGPSRYACGHQRHILSNICNDNCISKCLINIILLQLLIAIVILITPETWSGCWKPYRPACDICGSSCLQNNPLKPCRDFGAFTGGVSFYNF